MFSVSITEEIEDSSGRHSIKTPPDWWPLQRIYFRVLYRFIIDIFTQLEIR